MSKKTVLLIDGENILHQSFHKFEKLKSTDGKPSGAIFGFEKSEYCPTRFAIGRFKFFELMKRLMENILSINQ